MRTHSGGVLPRSSLIVPEQISDINLTPLVDLTFTLLIMFVITFPLIEHGIPVNLPRAKAENLSSDRSRSVTVGLQGKLYLDNVPITKAELASRMRTIGRSDPGIVVLIRADEGIMYGELVGILKIVHDAKISKMALVTKAADRGP